MKNGEVLLVHTRRAPRCKNAASERRERAAPIAAEYLLVMTISIAFSFFSLLLMRIDSEICENADSDDTEFSRLEN